MSEYEEIEESLSNLMEEIGQKITEIKTDIPAERKKWLNEIVESIEEGWDFEERISLITYASKAIEQGENLSELDRLIGEDGILEEIIRTAQDSCKNLKEDPNPSSYIHKRIRLQQEAIMSMARKRNEQGNENTAVYLAIWAEDLSGFNLL